MFVDYSQELGKIWNILRNLATAMDNSRTTHATTAKAIKDLQDEVKSLRAEVKSLKATIKG